MTRPEIMKKLIADGVVSRPREAMVLIRENRVTVDGDKLTVEEKLEDTLTLVCTTIGKAGQKDKVTFSKGQVSLVVIVPTGSVKKGDKVTISIQKVR